MKKVLVLALAFTMLFSVPVMASNEETKEKVEGYKQFEAEVVEIIENEKIHELLVKHEESKMFIYVNDESIIDLKTGEFAKKHSFSVGEKILFYIKENAPMMLSEPPKVGTEIVAVNYVGGEHSIDVDYFDKEGNGISNRLKINGLDNTKIITLNDSDLSKDEVLGNNLAVIYTISTRSIPPQTVPEKIIVLIDDAKGDVELPESKIEIDGKEVYAIRSYYENLGATVEWDPETKYITISGNEEKIVIDSEKSLLTIGDQESEIEYFTIKEGTSFSTIKLFEKINGHLFK